jgi:DNA-binding transcriptional LysR family regulator
MELEDFRIFLAVVRRGTLTSAGEETHLSQPAITRRLQRLEQRLGARLFEREGRRLRLTDAGAHFQRRAEDILGEVSDLATELSAFGEGARGELRIGATVTACLYLLPPVFRRFRERHPRHQVIVRNDRSGRMSDLVHERRVEVGVASVLAPRQELRAIPWRELELGLLCPTALEDHPVALASLARAPMVVPSAGTLRTLTESVFARCEIAPPIVAECDSLEVIKALVADGFGQAILPRICVQPHEPGVRFVDLIDPLPRLPVAVLVSRAREMSPPVQAFLDVIQQPVPGACGNRV